MMKDRLILMHLRLFQVKEKGKQIDLSDLYKDPLLVFQRKYYKPLVLLFCFIIPTIVPWCLWDESFLNSCFVPCILRLVSTQT